MATTKHIRLKHLAFCWNPGSCDFEIYDFRQEAANYGAYSHSVGAIFLEWHEYSEQERLIKLFSELVTIVHNDGIPYHKMHAELLRVPEYRALLSPDSCRVPVEPATRPNPFDRASP